MPQRSSAAAAPPSSMSAASGLSLVAAPTPSALGQLALSSAPLTAATSLLRLLAPDVQSYIRQHEAEAAAAAAAAGESSQNAAAAAPRASHSGGSGLAVGAGPLSLSGGVAMRIATTSSVPDHAHAAAASSSTDIPFGRRRGATRTPSFTTLSPPLSPRGSTRAKRTHTGGAEHTGAGDAASVHAQLQVDYATATAAAAAAAAAASVGVSPSASSASLSASPTATGAATSRGSRLRERERHALAMLHRALPDSDGAGGGGGGPIVTPPLFNSAGDLHTQTQGAANDATAAAVNGPSGTTPLYEGGPRLFHSASRELLMGLDPGVSGGGAQTSRTGPTHTRTLEHGTASGPASARVSKKQLGSQSPSRYSGLSFTSAHTSQVSLNSSATPGGGGGVRVVGDIGAAEHASSHGAIAHAGRFHPPSPSSAAFDSKDKDGYSSGAADKWTTPSSHDKKPRHSPFAATSAAAVPLLREFDDLVSGSHPRLLTELVQALSEEMRLQGLSDRDPPSRARLQIYRECFQNFTHHFRTYKPILARILSEYEGFLAAQDRQLEALPGLQRRLGTLQALTDQQLARERSAARQREEAAHAENLRLRGEIAALALALQDAQGEHKASREELAASRAAMAQLSESHTTLKQALQRCSGEKAQAWEAAAAESELSKKLHAKVSDLAKQQEALLHELSLLRKHASLQSQACSSADVQHMQEESAALATALQNAEASYARRSAEYFELLTAHEAAVRDSQALALEREELVQLKRCSTPRPQWQRLLENQYLPDSVNLSLQSSESLLDEMCGEMDRLRAALAAWERRYPSEEEVAALESQLALDGVKLAVPTHLRLRGSGPEVPLYLRWGSKPGQKIRNKNISKRDTELLIKECWAMKHHSPIEGAAEPTAAASSASGAGGTNAASTGAGAGAGAGAIPALPAVSASTAAEYRAMPLEDFIYIFLKRKYGYHDSIVAHAYSLVDALERFRFDGDVDMFLQILRGALSEQVYHDQHAMLSGLKTALAAADGELHKGRVKGRLPRRIFLDVLGRFFSSKGEPNLRRLSRALFLTDRSETLNYLTLFGEDREGNQTPFVELVRDQHLQEIFSFMSEIQSRLLEKSKRFGGSLSVAQVREVITVMDPTKPAREVEAYLRAGCGVATVPSAPAAAAAMAAPPPLVAKSSASGKETKAAAAAAAAAAAQAAQVAQSAAAAAAAAAAAPFAELDDNLRVDPAEFFSNMSRLLIKRTGPPPPDKSELARRGSVALALRSASASASGASTLAATSATTTARNSGRNSPDDDDGKQSPSDSSPQSTPQKVTFALPPTGSGSGSGTAAPGASAGTAPRSGSGSGSGSGRPGFSQLARRLSMPGAANLANVVLAARAQQQQQQQRNPAQQQASHADATTAATADAKTASPSAPQSPLAPAPAHSPAPHSPTSTSTARQAASHASLDRLTSFVLARAERQRAESQRAAQAADGSGGGGIDGAEDSRAATVGSESQTHATVVLELRREGEDFAAERRELELERSRLASNSSRRSPEQADPPRLSVVLPAEVIAPHAHASSSSPAAATAAAASTSPARSSSSPRGTGGAPKSAASVSFAASPPAAVAAGAAAAVAGTGAPVSPASPPAVFTPVSAAIIATRKSHRLSMRKSGGLAALLAQQRIADPDSIDPDLADVADGSAASLADDAQATAADVADEI